MLVPFETVHAYDILDRSIRDSDMWLTDSPDWEKWIKRWKADGPAQTLVIDGQVIGCGGVTLLEWNQGQAWTLFSPLIDKYPVACFRAIRNGLTQVIAEHGLQRVQAFVKADFEVGKRFVECFGFQSEGVMKAFGPAKEDVIMYGRIN